MTNMKNITLIFVLFCFGFFACKQEETQKEEALSPQEFIKENIAFSGEKYTTMLAEHTDTQQSPRTTDPDGSFKTVAPRGWTSGFYPGSLWYLYEYTGDEKWKKAAENWTAPLVSIKDYTGTHDLGFMLYCSFGNGYRLTNNEDYKTYMIDGAKALSTRFNPTVGLIRSWDHGSWQFPVIIDNMMNLEFLFWATKATGDSSFYNIAVTHADNTIANHFRDDWSSFHVVDYDTLTGESIWKGTHQGAADETAWSRGQAWGLYGYTVMYRETKDEKYLDVANNIAKFYLDHKNMPEDLIPYWDFDRPGEERDVSAAAIASSALFELAEYVDGALKEKYEKSALKMLESMASPAYKAVDEKNNNFILMHSTGNKNGGKEIDVPLVYADYYFIEALARYKNKLEGKQIYW